MADEKPLSKINVPRLRVPSHTLNDTSFSSLPNVSHRTISSSTSLLSTPSNNIRRVQQQINGQGKPVVVAKNRSKQSESSISGVSSTGAASRKLLNLQQLRRAQTGAKLFVLRKPAALSNYDYSVFVAPYKNNDTEGTIPGAARLIKDSQIKAWESAEKISADIIFDSEETGHHDTEATFAETSMDGDFLASDDTNLNDEGRFDGVDRDRPTSLLESIPLYTKGELKVILDNFDKLRTCTSTPNYHEIEDCEKKELWLYRQRQNVTQERAFTTNHSLVGKRKVQVFHKKEFLHKLFGYSNNINQECSTNNTSYSACDNAFSAQKAFHEDKDEILGLLAEDKAFEEELRGARETLNARLSEATFSPEAPKKCFDLTMDNSDLLDLTNSWLTSSYEKQSEIHQGQHALDVEPDDHPEVLAYTLGLLKQRVKEACDEPIEAVLC